MWMLSRLLSDSVSIPSNYIFWIKVAVLILVAFLPSLLYMRWIRNAEIYNREPWLAITLVFLWGAITAIVIAAIIEALAMYAYGKYLERTYEFLRQNESLQTLVLACIIAPFVEEGAKVLGVYFARRHLIEIEDGFIYGAAAGLGFAATENLLYESMTLVKFGLIFYIIIVLVRTTSSALLHGSATAVSGYGLSRKYLYKGHFTPFFLLAVSMHALFNLFASFSLIFDGKALPLLGFLFAIIMGVASAIIIRKKIQEMDAIRRNLRYGAR